MKHLMQINYQIKPLNFFKATSDASGNRFQNIWIKNPVLVVKIENEENTFELRLKTQILDQIITHSHP
jgi:hypothetical protein